MTFNLKPVIPIVVLLSALEIIWGYSPDLSEILKFYGIRVYILRYNGLIVSVFLGNQGSSLYM
jgi:hypothetical protein